MNLFDPFITSNPIVDYVISHKDCADGTLASWIVKRYGGKKFEASQYLFMKAGAKFEEQPVDDKVIFFLDVMPQNMEEIIQKAKFIAIIDHHVHPNYALFWSLKQKYPDKIMGVVHDQGEKCASDLAWDFFQQKPRPLFVRIVSTNDLWKWETAPPEYKAIWRCIFQGKTDVDFDQLMLKEDYSQEIRLGKAMLEEDEKIIQEHMKRAQLRTVWLEQDWKVYLVEGCPYGFISVLGARLAEKVECDFVAISNQEEKEFAVSLRSYKKKADVGEIAVLLYARCKDCVIKGGGHPNAAGIRLNCDPKELFTVLNPTEEDKTQERAAWSKRVDTMLNAPPVYNDPVDADKLTIYDKYGNQRSPTSVGCNDKFTWDIGTMKLDADIDLNSDNFIYDKKGNRVTTAQGMLASSGGTERPRTLHGNLKPAGVGVDVSSPKQI